MIDSCSPLRTPMNLCGLWEMTEDREENLIPYAAEFERRTRRRVTLPADIGTLIPERPFAEGVFWFLRSFEMPLSDDSQRRIILHFDSVNYETSVFVNDSFVGSSHLGFLPFEFDITSVFRPNAKNTVLVRVDTRRYSGQFPTSFFWRNAGGITRDIYVYTTPESYIISSHATAHADGNAEISVKLSGIDERSPYALKLNMTDPCGETVYSSDLTALAGEQIIPVKIEKPALWSPESPDLYRISVELYAGNKIVDRTTYQTGFRDIAVHDGKIWLNGSEIFLKGFNRHEDHPNSGGACSAASVESDFTIIKQSGANFIRMCHYPHDERELEAADRLGILLLVEIPLCAYNQDHIGITDGTACGNVEKVYNSARKSLERMIARDRSHPSIIIWSVSNETGENRPDGEKVIRLNNSLMQVAKAMDPSRLAVHVSNHPKDEKRGTFFTEDDIICINIYPSISNPGHGSPQKAAEGAKDIQNVIRDLQSLYPGKPLIVTEFGYRSSSSFDGPDDEENQAVSVVTELKAIYECASGASVWIFADHLWPQCSYLQDDESIARYGLLKRDRTPKKAFDSYSRCMKELQ